MREDKLFIEGGSWSLKLLCEMSLFQQKRITMWTWHTLVCSEMRDTYKLINPVRAWKASGNSADNKLLFNDLKVQRDRISTTLITFLNLSVHANTDELTCLIKESDWIVNLECFLWTDCLKENWQKRKCHSFHACIWNNYRR